MFKILLLSIFCAFTSSFADFSCASEVSYKWKKNGEEEIKTYWTKVIEKSATEPIARQVLDNSILKEKQLAEKACKREHENLANCMASQFATKSAVLANLNFQARRALEEAISADCKAQQGVCVDSSASEVKCEEQKAAEPEAEKDAKAGEKGEKPAEDKKKK